MQPRNVTNIAILGTGTMGPGIALLCADRYWATAEYFEAGCGMTRESTLWLVEQGVRVMGVDAWGWDRPFWAIREEFCRTGDKGVLWAAHYAGIDKEYCHIEKLANLDKLPRPFGFKVACFPVRLMGEALGRAAWSPYSMRSYTVLSGRPRLQ